MTKCLKCKIEKSETEFSKNGKCFLCNEKEKQWRAEYYAKNSESVRQKRKDYLNTKRGYKLDMLNHAKRRALAKGLPFDLTVDDIPDVPEYCPVLKHIKLQRGSGRMSESSPSLDRKDPAKGYIKENIQVISNRANKLKSDGTVEEIEMVLEHLKNLK